MNNDIRELDIFFNGGVRGGGMSEAALAKTIKPAVADTVYYVSTPTLHGDKWTKDKYLSTTTSSVHDFKAYDWINGPTCTNTPEQEAQLQEMIDLVKLKVVPKDDTKPREFGTGATRSNDTGRYDPEAFLSPIVLERYSEYMNKNRVQPDGSVRDGDNWQKGIPLAQYMKGMWRHMLHVWTRHRGFKVQDKMASVDMEEDLCAIMFNAQGMLFELIKAKRV